MTNVSATVRAWRDEDFAETLTEAKKAELLPSPVGELMLGLIRELDISASESTSVFDKTHCSTSAFDCCGTSVFNTCSTSVFDCCK
jgi:mersacidin/lichenicidin family type 2 lantibiotic